MYVISLGILSPEMTGVKLFLCFPCHVRGAQKFKHLSAQNQHKQTPTYTLVWLISLSLFLQKLNSTNYMRTVGFSEPLYWTKNYKLLKTIDSRVVRLEISHFGKAAKWHFHHRYQLGCYWNWHRTVSLVFWGAATVTLTSLACIKHAG